MALPPAVLPPSPDGGLGGFLQGTYRLAGEALQDGRFSARQQALLQAALGEYQRGVALNPASDPVAIFHLLPRAYGRPTPALARQLAASGVLLTLAGKLFDDVQDEDLAGTPYAQLSPALVLNTALTLLMLGVELLRRALPLEPDEARRPRYLEVLTRVFLTGLAGQHRDVEGLSHEASLEECLAVAGAKGAGFTLLVECAALCAGCAEEDVARFRRAAEALGQLRQVVDDVRDVFGKALSPDFAAGKRTALFAFFAEAATPAQREALESLRPRLPTSMPEVRQLLYASGAVRLCSQRVEALREAIHAEVAATGRDAPSLRTWLQVVDSLAGTLYVLPALPCTRSLFQPQAPWHQQVRAVAAQLHERLARFSPPALPRLVPWHTREWTYDVLQRTIHYPDVSGQPEEILPVQARALGLEDTSEVERLLWATLPMTAAHEYFHAWRHASGRLSSDWWFEEWAANRLAISYVQAHHPALLPQLREVADRLLAQAHPGAAAEEVLARLFAPDLQPGTAVAGYALPMEELVAVQVTMTRRLLGAPLSLEREVAHLLGAHA